MTLLDISGLRAGYGDSDVLSGVDLSVGKGDFVALIGPNGAGKSTVLKSVFSIADVHAGTIVFAGEDITGLPTHELLSCGVSYVPQGRINFSTLTVRENLELGARPGHGEERVEQNLSSVYERYPVLEEKSGELAYSLSGGEQQMLALGRALMQEPELLLLDEPSLGLAPNLVSNLFARLEELKEDGLSLLVVEQNAKQAIGVADRTYLLENGEIALSGADITEHPKIRQVYLGGDIDE